MSDFEVRRGGRPSKANGKVGAHARDLVPEGTVIKVSTPKPVDATDLVPKGTVVKVPTRKVADGSDLVPDADDVRMRSPLHPRTGPKTTPTTEPRRKQAVEVRKDAQAKARPVRRQEGAVEVRQDAAVAQPTTAPKEAARVKVVKPAAKPARPTKTKEAPTDFVVAQKPRNVRLPEAVDLGSVVVIPPGQRRDGSRHGAEPKAAEVTVKKPKRRTPPKFLKSVMETLEIKPRRRRKADTSDMGPQGEPQVTLDTDSVWTPENMRKSTKRKK